MAHMAAELSSLSAVLPTINLSSSMLYPIATSQCSHYASISISTPPAQPLKRKVQESMRGNSPPGKKEKTTGAETASQEVPKAVHTSPNDSAEVVRRSCSSISVTHHTLRRFESELEEAEKTHNQVVGEQPDNPILPDTGKPRFTFSEYQMKPPTETMIEVFKDEPKRHEFLLDNAQFWHGRCMIGRLRKQMGLRDWEWAMGEPQRLPSDHVINESAKYVKGRKRRDRLVLDVEEDNLTFAERVKNFTYTRKDDPMCRGRKIVLKPGNKLRAVRGDFADEVDDEDFMYDTDFEDTCAVTQSRG